MKMPVAMRKRWPHVPLLGAVMMVLAACGTTHNGTGAYDPSNPASPTGYTAGYQLYRSIGCAGSGLLDKACPLAMLPVPAAKPQAILEPTPDPTPGPAVVVAPLPEPVPASKGEPSAIPVATAPVSVGTGEPANEGAASQTTGMPGPGPTPHGRPTSSAGHGAMPAPTPEPGGEQQAPGPAPVRLAASAFHVPSPIRVEQTVVAQLRINPCKDLENMRLELVPENTRRPGELATARVEITDIMRAELKTDETALRIKPLSPGTQKVVACDTTVWTWSVTGLREGAHELIVTLLKLLPEGEAVTVPTPVYTVEVKVKPAEGILNLLKLGTDIMKSTTALVVATVGLFAALGFGWARKRQGKPEAQAPGGKPPA